MCGLWLIRIAGRSPRLSTCPASTQPYITHIGKLCAGAAGSAMQVRVVRPVTAGEQLTVTYINLMEPRHIRARQLMDTKHFACACDRCTQPLEASPDRFLEVRSFSCIHLRHRLHFAAGQQEIACKNAPVPRIAHHLLNS